MVVGGRVVGGSFWLRVPRAPPPRCRARSAAWRPRATVGRPRPGAGALPAIIVGCRCAAGSGPRRHHRDGDGLPGVGHPQPRRRRPRLGRAVPAAALAGLGHRGAADGPLLRDGRSSTTPWSRSTAGETGDITEVAQAVQRSAYPDAYRDHEADARVLASVFTGNSPAGLSCLERAGADGDLDGLQAGLRKTVGTPEIVKSGTTMLLKAESAKQAWAYASFAVANSGRYGVAGVTVGDRVLGISGDDLAEWGVSDDAVAKDEVRIIVRPCARTRSGLLAGQLPPDPARGNVTIEQDVRSRGIDDHRAFEFSSFRRLPGEQELVVAGQHGVSRESAAPRPGGAGATAPPGVAGRDPPGCAAGRQRDLVLAEPTAERRGLFCVQLDLPQRR